VTELETLVHLQEHDRRIAALEAEAARLPREIAALQAALGEARQAVEAARARLEAARKELRHRERDLDDLNVKRTRAEARLWEVKTNVEYSAMLAEIEHIKAQKARAEEEILALMERQEGLTAEIREAEARLRAREEQARRDEAVIRDRLAAVEQELAGARGDRAAVAGRLPRPLLTDYERILRARGGLAVVPVSAAGICGGCRVAIRPQAVQEVRGGALVHCESCGRYLFWQE
jgi:hypothetical protein